MMTIFRKDNVLEVNFVRKRGLAYRNVLVLSAGMFEEATSPRRIYG